MSHDVKKSPISEIEEALKEFEVKTKTQAEEAEKSLEDLVTSEISLMDKFVIDWSGGLVKESKMADEVLLGFSIMAIFISMLLILGVGRGPYIPIPPGTKIVYQPYEPPRLEKLLVLLNPNEFAKK